MFLNATKLNKKFMNWRERRIQTPAAAQQVCKYRGNVAPEAQTGHLEQQQFSRRAVWPAEPAVE